MPTQNKAVDWQSLWQKIQSMAKKAPAILLLLEQLFANFKQKEQALQSAPRCPSEHVAAHLEAAISLEAQVMCELLCAHGCCCPDDEGGGNQAGTTPTAGQTQAAPAQGQGGKTQQQ